ncbi:MAG: hypothetical protein WBA46_15160 [Thermomicrobiales bacterium]
MRLVEAEMWNRDLFGFTGSAFATGGWSLGFTGSAFATGGGSLGFAGSAFATGG